MGASAGDSASSAGDSVSSAGHSASSAETLSTYSDPSPSVQLQPQLPAPISHHQQAAAAALTGEALSEQHVIDPMQARLVSEPNASRRPGPLASSVDIISAGLLSSAAQHDAAQQAPKDPGLLSSEVQSHWPAWVRRLERILSQRHDNDASSALVSGSSTAINRTKVHSLMPFFRSSSQPATLQASTDDTALNDPYAEVVSDRHSLIHVKGARAEQLQHLRSFPKAREHEPDARFELRDADERARSVICKGSTLRHQACQGMSTSSWSGRV